jgi:hypothetical protein
MTKAIGKTAICCLLAFFVATAATAKDRRHVTFEDRITEQSSIHTRYPGDVAYPFGTVHVRGGKKIPYVEKCHWTYRLGHGLKQTCVRYTLENTR